MANQHISYGKHLSIAFLPFFLLACRIDEVHACKGDFPLNFIENDDAVTECEKLKYSKSFWYSVKDKNDGYKYFVIKPKKTRKLSKVIVRIPGGPGDQTHLRWNTPSIYAKNLVKVAEACEAPIVNMAYTGTAPRQSIGINTYTDAVKDVDEWLKQLQVKFGKENIVIVAESLGPLILSQIMEGRQGVKIILVNPLSLSPEQWKDKVEKDGSYHFRNINRIYDKDNKKWYWKKIDSDFLFYNFFEFSQNKDVNRKSIVDNFGKLRVASGVVIYDPHDPINSGSISVDYSKLGFKVFKFTPLDHSFLLVEDNERRAVDIIYREVKKFCDGAG